ncbi:MAG: hypothetical protein WCT03_11440 [Candidatus Obscuribacterales bacterium]
MLNRVGTIALRDIGKAIAVLALASTVTLSLLLPQPCAAAKISSKKVDKFEFKVEINGTSTLLLGDDGAIWRVPNTGIIYYCMAPKWDIIVFNTSTNRARIYEYAHWHLREEGKSPIKVKTKSTIPSTFNGMPATWLYLTIEPMESLKNQGEFFYRSSTKRAHDYSRMEVLELQDKKISKHVLDFVRYRFSMPFLNGPPLKSTNVYPDGKRETTLQATSMTHITIPISEWQNPKKFKSVKSASLVNDERRKFKNAADMFDTLMP